ncbi:hypothetical protein GC194_01715 [bacterium]|nr:hypothetical protein [bacterium]
MKLRVAIFCALLSLPFLSHAQLELGARFGIANYRGDLAPKIIPSESNLAGGLMLRANINANWKFRTNLTFGRVSGRDRALLPADKTNLNFRSSVLELAFEMEYDFLPFLPGSPNLTFTPYIFGGVAGFYFNPQAELVGRTYINLRPLGTEGQTIPGSNLNMYSNYGISFPFGLGFKKTVSDGIIFGLEVGLRPTLTDYLDDVSGYYPDFTKLAATQYGATAVAMSDRRPEIGLDAASAGTLRGNPNNRDWYGFFLISITKKLGSSPCYTF